MLQQLLTDLLPTALYSLDTALFDNQSSIEDIRSLLQRVMHASAVRGMQDDTAQTAGLHDSIVAQSCIGLIPNLLLVLMFLEAWP